MVVNYIIVQEIVKEQGVLEAHLIPNDTLLPINELSIRLTENLNDRYNKKVINRAIFRDSEENETVFSEKFKDFNSDRSEQNFIDFSKRAINSLKIDLERVPFATGGYFVFIDYSLQSNINYTACFLVRNTDGLIFIRNEETGEFRISEQFHIDFEKLAVGCRISLNAYNGNENLKYLNFITGKNEPVSDYFKDWINAYQFEDEKADSNNLIELMNVLPLPFKDDGTEMTRDEFKRSVFENIKATPNKKTVDLNTINRMFYGENNVIEEYIENNQIPISTLFNARDNIIRRLVKFDVFADNIKISFPYELFDENLVIIRSKNLADKIRLEENN